MKEYLENTDELTTTFLIPNFVHLLLFFSYISAVDCTCSKDGEILDDYFLCR